MKFDTGKLKKFDVERWNCRSLSFGGVRGELEGAAGDWIVMDGNFYVVFGVLL